MRRARVAQGNRVLDVEVDATGTPFAGAGDEPLSGGFRWLPPATGTVIGVALNDREQIRPLAAAFHAAPHGRPPAAPVLFVKPGNTLTGHLDPVVCPPDAASIQPGGSLALVIGRQVPQCAARARLAECLLGYTIFNDFSLPSTSFYRPPVRSKCHDGFGPMGPWIVEPAAVPDAGAVVVETRINDRTVQATCTSDLVHSAADVLQFVNAFSPLAAGDVIVLSVPVQRFDVGPGDTVTIEIAGIGALTNTVSAAVTAGR